jgi:hypothetical protein
MALINTPILPQNFEIVRDRIAEILVTEIENQITQGYDPLLEDVQVFPERIIPLDDTHMPCICINLNRGNFGVKTMAGSAMGEYVYQIDAYGKASSEVSGDDITPADYLAAVVCQRLLGLARAILEDPQYRTLGYAAPSISSVRFSDMLFEEPRSGSDFTMVQGRLNFYVTVNESCSLLTAELLTGHTSELRLGNSEKGYNYNYTA